MFCCLLVSPSDIALAVARSCSPRIARYGDAVVFDVTGCSRTIGSPETITREVTALAGEGARVAVAPTVTAAWLLAHARPATTVARPGAAADALADIPVGWLGTIAELDLGQGSRGSKGSRGSRGSKGSKGSKSSKGAKSAEGAEGAKVRELLAIFERWGVRTLGDLAALPSADVRTRRGPLGARLHQAAAGQDAAPFVPMDEVPRFTDRVELEWPIEGLEPLAFVLARSCERLSEALQRADRGAVAIRTTVRLVTRDTHTRLLHLPTPMADARMLRTLILLDLESHPPPAAIDVVSLDLDVSPGPVLQGALFKPALPQPEALATLIARLTALMGASQVGAPAVLDTHDARAVGMQPFHVPAQVNRRPGPDSGPARADTGTRLPPVVRRLRRPVAARVEVDRSMPIRVMPSARGLAGGPVVSHAGPCRSSGGWWTLGVHVWDRDEWDVELAGGTVYRIARDRVSGHWEIEGMLD